MTFYKSTAGVATAGGGGGAQAAEVVVGEVFAFGLPCLAAAAFEQAVTAPVIPMYRSG